jgi:hypothetical protein
MVLALSPALLSAARHAAPPDPYVRPSFAAQIQELRPAILRAARRHNHPELSGMSDSEFAATIAQILYNEHAGWLEDAVPPLRAVTPAYQWAQIALNQAVGTNFSVWPSNLRPSVAAEILRGELPVHGQPHPSSVPVAVSGTQIDLRQRRDERALYQAANAEISRADLAVEYLAANLERGLYLAKIEGVPVTWETLAAWHNQGIVAPAEIRRNPTATDYIRRAAPYRPLAERLVAGGTPLRSQSLR